MLYHLDYCSQQKIDQHCGFNLGEWTTLLIMSFDRSLLKNVQVSKMYITCNIFYMLLIRSTGLKPGFQWIAIIRNNFFIFFLVWIDHKINRTKKFFCFLLVVQSMRDLRYRCLLKDFIFVSLDAFLVKRHKQIK